MLVTQILAALASDAARFIGGRRSKPSAGGRSRCPQFAPEMLEGRVLLSVAPAFFQPQQTFTAGTDPQAVAVADFNGDHTPDLVVANFGDNSVSLFIGTGGGNYAAQKTFSVGQAPNGIVVADFNRDGNEDVAVANRNGNDVSILLGDGTGNLTLQNDLTAGTGPRALAVGDFNKDNIPDLVVANFGTNNASYFQGNGDGTFQPEVLIGSLGEPNSIAVGDFNGDGNLDYVTSNFNSAGFAVSPGNGNGTFGIGSVTNLPANGSAGVAVADVNGDGKADVVVSNFTTDSVSVALGNNNLTFATPQIISTATGSNPSFVALADVNGDGKLDIVVNTANSAVGTLLGDGTGAFAAVQTVATGNEPGEIAIADVNGDGSPDLIAPNFDDGTISVLLNDPPPALMSINSSTPTSTTTQATDVTFTVKFTEPVSNLSATDFELNLAAGMSASAPILTPATGPASQYTVEVKNIIGNGTVGLTLVQSSAIVNDMGETLKPFAAFSSRPAVNSETDDIAVGDLNRDGRPDVVIANQGGFDVAVALGQANGNLGTPVGYSTGANSQPRSVAIADINGDGKLDVIAADSATDQVSVLLGNGDGTLAAQVTYPLDTGDNPRDLQLADINGDGFLDIIVANFGSNTIGVLEGKADGTFRPEETLHTGAGPSSVAVGDFNGDGGIDIAVANTTDATVSLFLHSPPVMGIPLGLPFLNPQTIATKGNTTTLFAGDFNGDHKTDLLAVNSNQDNVVFLAGDGAGNFAAPVINAAPNGLLFAAMADINGDGIPDIVGTDNIRDLSVMLGNGDGTYQHQQQFNEALELKTVATADMNGDGIPDIVAGNFRVAAGQQFETFNVILTTTASTFAGDTFTILKRDAALTVTGTDAIFDGNPHAASVVATGAQGEDLTSLASLSYTNTADETSSTTAPTQPGTYEVFSSFAGNSSYNVIGSTDSGQQVIIAPLSPLQSIPSGNLPTASLISGQKIKPIRFTVKLNNTGATALAEAVTVQAALSLTPSGTPSDPVVRQIQKTAKIKGHKTTGFGTIIIRSIPAGLSGTYNVLFKLTDATGAANLASAGTITVGPASNDLAALSVTAPAKARIGKKLASVVQVAQNGNIPFAGSLSAELFLSTTSTLGSSAIDLGQAGGHLSIKPGKHAGLKLSASIPSTVTAGNYFLIVKLLPSTTPPDTNSADDIVTSVKMVAVS